MQKTQKLHGACQQSKQRSDPDGHKMPRRAEMQQEGQRTNTSRRARQVKTSNQAKRRTANAQQGGAEQAKARDWQVGCGRRSDLNTRRVPTYKVHQPQVPSRGNKGRPPAWFRSAMEPKTKGGSRPCHGNPQGLQYKFTRKCQTTKKCRTPLQQ